MSQLEGPTTIQLCTRGLWGEKRKIKSLKKKKVPCWIFSTDQECALHFREQKINPETVTQIKEAYTVCHCKEEFKIFSNNSHCYFFLTYGLFKI